MEKLGMFFTDSTNFVYLPNKEIQRKLFGNNWKAMILFRKIKNKYNIETVHITLTDLENARFKDIKELPKNITELLNNVLKDI